MLSFQTIRTRALACPGFATLLALAGPGAPVAQGGGLCPPSYIIDDGSADIALFGGVGLDSMWLNHFVVLDGQETIVGADVCWVGWNDAGFLPAGHPISVFLLSDPDQDGRPGDAQVLAGTQTTVDVAAPNQFQHIVLPATNAGGAGASFFVAIFTTTPGEPPKECSFPGCSEAWYPSCATLSVDGSEASWIANWPAGTGGPTRAADLVSLASVGYGAAFMLRAVSVGDAIPGDLDCDGDTDGADLGALLASWGTCAVGATCAGDLDSDGDVDAADLGLLLAGWG